MTTMKLILLLPLLIIAVIIYSLIENRYIKTSNYILKLTSDGSVTDVSGAADQRTVPEISIVQLSDLHGCRYGKNNDVLLQKIQACKPDIILLTGDMKNKYKPVVEDYFNFLKQLSELCPCIYSLGNHELKDREKNPESFIAYMKRVRDCGIIVSDNAIHSLCLKDISCLFASYSSSLDAYRRKRFCKEIENTTENDIPYSELSEFPVKILLSHDPELRKQYCESDYSIIFSGHLHGGIVRIPGYRGIISTRFVLFPQYDGGCYQLDEKHVLIVSRGLGSHTIKFRLFNRPEIVHTLIHYEA